MGFQYCAVRVGVRWGMTPKEKGVSCANAGLTHPIHIVTTMMEHKCLPSVSMLSHLI
jgi:hypothetical protein